MRSQVTRHLNEIVSLSFMGIMIIALIAGQAGASSRAAAQAQAGTEQPVEIRVSFRHQGELK